jgi:hypothetical protein
MASAAESAQMLQVSVLVALARINVRRMKIPLCVAH